MALLEKPAQSLHPPSLHEQIERARARQSSPENRRRRDEMLRRTHGILDETDGEAFEQAMNAARRVEEHG